ncbi:50S ribosomal protein L18 [bacterium (Candidatus Gribaldobacteria) CG07_land_8_20_14_0_80_33_18]|uniref:Large ribosomal subunit protein uL18 n=1 Tax=bacterium (Candidatus Gribaldobacteria) CG07_land_8_20_14_0_80_33_18 TaxID=2014272 RepID=A0A2M6Z2X7_9BACT|nr:MAG: 50S ribosomal protein L18 [bacterium (Candidatus Gribaldobacteria) CG10_big_fil_rev_8_21_14_0_10_33_41]PIU46736.1 MAG: 50S ribosomal protein L18 [bacterium (Candidatus Gribaldobacteria) CG07_land_8_20_14_0_80_33_18]PJA00436.1 MAG: 50S ribosomal protein L18 [bacterium (Candidatus Gribaldobacteria) CG_4_10_14_0_2_um_filter_33_15]PJB08441.1 MAG: 50S ribosomal protein L18 [bacterium (Candidatus Gribaldobacteria) CG_4_9_14_3_um_filter_33_9]
MLIRQEKSLRRRKRRRRHKRIRAKIFGTKEKPRLCVFRSNKHIYAQLIDDNKGDTLLSASDLSFVKQQKRSVQKSKITKKDIALEVGKLIAKKALEKKIKRVVFDKGGYKYRGRVSAVAEGAREGGLKF